MSDHLLETILNSVWERLIGAVLAPLFWVMGKVPGLAEIAQLPWQSFVWIGLVILFVGIWQRSRSLLVAAAVVGTILLWLLWPRGRAAANGQPIRASPSDTMAKPAPNKSAGVHISFWDKIRDRRK